METVRGQFCKPRARKENVNTHRLDTDISKYSQKAQALKGPVVQPLFPVNYSGRSRHPSLHNPRNLEGLNTLSVTNEANILANVLIVGAHNYGQVGAKSYSLNSTDNGCMDSTDRGR